MKKILFVASVLIAFAACTHERINRKWVTVHFLTNHACDTVTFSGENGQGTYVFVYNGIPIVSKHLPSNGTYTISAPNQVSECHLFLLTSENGGGLGFPPDNPVVTMQPLLSDYEMEIQCR